MPKAIGQPAEKQRHYQRSIDLVDDVANFVSLNTKARRSRNLHLLRAFVVMVF
jgi:hypothetical protein